MKIMGETLTELNSTIEQIIREYEVIKYVDDGSIWPLVTQNNDFLSNRGLYTRGIDPNAEEWLRTMATKAHTCAINLFQQNPQLPEPPKPESEPLIELQQIRQWCIRAEAMTQPEQNQPASGGQAGDMNKPQEKGGQSKKQPKKIVQKSKYTPEKIKNMLTSYDKHFEESNDVKYAWNCVAEEHSIKSGKAAEMAVRRHQEKNK